MIDDRGPFAEERGPHHSPIHYVAVMAVMLVIYAIAWAIAQIGE